MGASLLSTGSDEAVAARAPAAHLRAWTIAPTATPGRGSRDALWGTHQWLDRAPKGRNHTGRGSARETSTEKSASGEGPMSSSGVRQQQRRSKRREPRTRTGSRMDPPGRTSQARAPARKSIVPTPTIRPAWRADGRLSLASPRLYEQRGRREIGDVRVRARPSLEACVGVGAVLQAVPLAGCYSVGTGRHGSLEPACERLSSSLEQRRSPSGLRACWLWRASVPDRRWPGAGTEAGVGMFDPHAS